MGDLLRSLNDYSAALLVLLTGCMVVLTALYVRYTGRMLAANQATLRALVEQSWQTNRGTMLVEPRFRDKYVFALRISNIGRSSANNLRLSLDRSLYYLAEADKRINDFPLFSKTIPQIPPGAVYNVDLWPGTIKPGTGNVPEEFKVVAQYESLGRPIIEETWVHMSIWTGQNFPTRETEESLERLSNSLKELNDFFKSYQFSLRDFFHEVMQHLKDKVSDGSRRE